MSNPRVLITTLKQLPNTSIKRQIGIISHYKSVQNRLFNSDINVQKHIWEGLCSLQSQADELDGNAVVNVQIKFDFSLDKHIFMYGNVVDVERVESSEIKDELNDK